MNRLAVVLALFLFSALPLRAAAPPVSDAEKAACEVVASHLAKGPSAIVKRLSANSPYASHGEVEARVGPAHGTVWQLKTGSDAVRDRWAIFQVIFPSGVDDIVAFEMEHAGDTWSIKSIRTSAELGAEERKAALTTAPNKIATAEKDPDLLWLMLLAPALGLIGGALRSRYPGLTSVLLVGALLAFSTVVAFIIDPDWMQRFSARMTSRPSTSASIIPMADLVPLRRAMATGVDGKGYRGKNQETAEIAALWSASMTDDLKKAQKFVESVEVLASSPMAVLLKARLALDAGKDKDAAGGYAQLRAQELGSDAFWYEELLVADPAKLAELLDKLPTRDAGIHYARIGLRKQEGRLSTRTFEEAWALAPLSRERILTSPSLARLVTNPAIATLVNLNTPDEHNRAAFNVSASPMEVPPGARTIASGAFVSIAIGNTTLEIPNGAAIAPKGTVIVSARDREREAGKRAIEDLEKMTSFNIQSAAAARTIESAVAVLTEHHRWPRILEITQGAEGEATNAPASLISARIEALIRTKRGDEARKLAEGEALRHAMQTSPNAYVLLEISEMLAAAGEWSAAIDMVKRASALPDPPDVSARLEQLALRQQLAASTSATRTAHFEIRATDEIPVTVPERIGDLLEAELVRVNQRLGQNEFHPTRVNVLFWEDFSEKVTGSLHTVGLYDGEITVPFGEVARFRDDVVSILTHEMTHAVIAQASDDAAPRWFQEGLASRMELVERQENIFTVRRGRPLLALELLDAMLVNHGDPEGVADAYTQAQTFIRFLEDRYGNDAPVKMIASFRGGASSDEALLALTGKTIAALDLDFRAWGLTHADAFLDKTPWPYMQFYSLGVDPNVRKGITWSKGKQP